MPRCRIVVGKNLKRYTFENQCIELPGLKLNDDSIKIFFNSKGKEDSYPITEEQDNFLKFLDTEEVTDDFTKQLKEAVEEVRENKKWRAEYMHTLVHEQDIRDEGIAIGLEQGIERGLEQGMQQEQVVIVRRLLQKNYSDSEIMEITECSQEVINSIKSEMV